MNHPMRRKTDKMEDHKVAWKYIASAVAGASTMAMVLLVINLLYTNTSNLDNNASLEMYEKYKAYSHSYANQLYDRVGNVTDVVTSYQRTTEFRLDQQQKAIEALQLQLAEAKVIVTNNNTQNNNHIEDVEELQCTGDNNNNN